MKRQKTKYRFYLWDYLWWAGERLHDYNARITGYDMVQMYLTFFVYLPLVMLCGSIRREYSIFLLGLLIVQVLAWLIWGEKIYSSNRRKAVMKHYATRAFSQGKGYFLFIMPFMFFLVTAILM